MPAWPNWILTLRLRRDPGLVGKGTLLEHQHARDADGGERKGVCPPREEELQPREIARLHKQQQRQEQDTEVEHHRHRIELTHQPRVGDEAYRWRRNQDEEGRHEALWDRGMEQQPIKDDRHQQTPEQHANAEEEPGDINKAQWRARHRHQHITDCRDKPEWKDDTTPPSMARASSITGCVARAAFTSATVLNWPSAQSPKSDADGATLGSVSAGLLESECGLPRRSAIRLRSRRRQ